MFDPSLFRGFERILDVLIGGLSIFLGYRLFLNLPDKTDSQGKIILPGNISIYLSRVGPGVFFALFGTCVVALSLHKVIQYRTEPAIPYQSHSTHVSLEQAFPTKTHYQGAIPVETNREKEEREIRRAILRRKMHNLNQIPSMLRTDLNPEKSTDVTLLLAAVKLELIKTVWGPEWGNLMAFERWVDLGAQGDPPEKCDEAAQLFRYGAEAESKGGQ